MAYQITKDTTIQEALALGDQSFEILGRYFGPGCLSCGAAAFETLEMGVLSHGLGEAKIPVLVKELQAVADQPSRPSPAGKTAASNPPSGAAPKK